jgi:hypothetical protein
LQRPLWRRGWHPGLVLAVALLVQEERLAVGAERAAAELRRVQHRLGEAPPHIGEGLELLIGEVI